jgi:hypothetical protein
MNLYLILAIIPALVTLIIIVSTMMIVWLVRRGRERSIARALRRWLLLDYMVLAILAFGLLFLFVDLVAVIRDRDAYPYYHYGYLLIGFLFSLIGGVFLSLRLWVTLRLMDDQHPKPE